MPPKPTRHIQTRRNSNVRIGPISIITLITVISLSVLGVLTMSTANATLTITNRNAVGSQLQYAAERAGQEFVADVDAALANVRASGGTAKDGARAVQSSLDSICESARSAGDGIACTATVDGTVVSAEIVCFDVMRLKVDLAIRPDGTYRVTRWKTTSVEQQPESAGQLWTGGT